MKDLSSTSREWSEQRPFPTSDTAISKNGKKRWRMFEYEEGPHVESTRIGGGSQVFLEGDWARLAQTVASQRRL